VVLAAVAVVMMLAPPLGRRCPGKIKSVDASGRVVTLDNGRRS